MRLHNEYVLSDNLMTRSLSCPLLIEPHVQSRSENTDAFVDNTIMRALRKFYSYTNALQRMLLELLASNNSSLDIPAFSVFKVGIMQ